MLKLLSDLRRASADEIAVSVVEQEASDEPCGQSVCREHSPMA